MRQVSENRKERKGKKKRKVSNETSSEQIKKLSYISRHEAVDLYFFPLIIVYIYSTDIVFSRRKSRRRHRRRRRRSHATTSSPYFIGGRKSALGKMKKDIRPSSFFSKCFPR